MFCKTCLCDENDGSNPLQLVVDKVGKIAEHIEYRNAEIVEEVKKNAKVPSNDTTDFKLSRRSRTQCVKLTFFYLIIAIVNLIKKKEKTNFSETTAKVNLRKQKI